ncbi:MAG TPA: hypothetical protein GYA10_05685 [Alphaproteobacteria bacterium]|nr:hypothetical protein [Alphaproteobacteria bacterium]
MKIILASLTAVALGLTATGALAQQTGSITGDTSFAGVDTDRNGLVTWPEFSLVFTDVNEEQFRTADLDGNGALSPDEFETIALSTGAVGNALSEDLPLKQSIPQSLTDTTTEDE